jgi:hypothetical protein
MRRGLNILLIIGLILAFQQRILAQDKGDKESPRDMVQRLQQEIEKLQADLAENPSSSKADRIKSRIQWNIRKIREISPDIKQPAEFKTKDGKAQKYGVERYTAIIKNNLFTPLGTVKEVKRQEFILTGILGKSAFIQLQGSSDSYYVTVGQTFSKGAKLASVGENSVTIIHEGTRKELRLNEGVPTSRSGGAKGGSTKGGSASKSSKKGYSYSKEAEAERRAEKERISKEEAIRLKQEKERENIEREISELSQAREDVMRYIMEMEENGKEDPGAYEKLERIEQTIMKLESSLP